METNAPGIAEVLTHFRFDLPWLLLIAGMAGGWVWLVRRAEAAGHPHPPMRTVAFAGGLVLLAAGTLSPLEYYGNLVLWANFLGFLVVTMIAAPLLMVAAPLTLAFRATGKTGRPRLRWLYRHFPVAWLSFPIYSWLAFAVMTYVWQFSELTELATRHWWLRDTQLFSLLLVSLFFWYPALASDPLRWRLPHPLRALYVFVEMTHKGLFGGMFLSMSSPFHQHFARVTPAWAPEPLTDQRMAILILWIGGNAFFLVVLITIVVGWMRYEMRNQHRTDVRLARKREAERQRRAALEQVFTR